MCNTIKHIALKIVITIILFIKYLGYIKMLLNEYICLSVF